MRKLWIKPFVYFKNILTWVLNEFSNRYLSQRQTIFTRKLSSHESARKEIKYISSLRGFETRPVVKYEKVITRGVTKQLIFF